MDVLKERMADSAVIRSDRAKLAEKYRTLAGELGAQVAGVRAINTAELDFYSPAPRKTGSADGDPWIRYFVDAERTYLCFVVPGSLTRQYELPGRENLAVYCCLFARLSIHHPPNGMQLRDGLKIPIEQPGLLSRSQPVLYFLSSRTRK